MDLDWLDAAACLGTDPDYWFPEKGGSDTITTALAICATCPVTEPCLELALLGGRRYAEGIYGAKTAEERRVMKREKRNGMAKQKQPNHWDTDRPFEDFEAWRVRAMLPEPADSEEEEEEESGEH